MSGLLAQATSRAAKAQVKRQVVRTCASWAERANPVYPSPWNKWFPYEPVPSTPKIGPYPLKLSESETYFFCTCGEGAAQPWCEGSEECCKVSPFKPMPYKPKNTGTILVCGCKKAPGVECNGTCALLYSDLNPLMGCVLGFSSSFLTGLFLTWIFHP
mmetsp:Transcript_44359/g.126606  ORF Transcript_44359/g.126606 Transcript_44359/m.126606 type:complete len:158 (-) Transcript_44359:40-513(-)